MLRPLRFVAIFGLLTPSFISQAQLAERFRAEKVQFLGQPTAVPSFSVEERQALAAYNYIFIDGLLGDLTRDLYQQVVPYLRAQLAVELRVLRPSSLNSASANVAYLRNELRKSSISKPNIVIAHSAGAAELFLALLENPELFERARIEKVIFVQGAFSGSPLAEWAYSFLSRGCAEFVRKALPTPCGLASIFAKSAHSLLPEVAIGHRVPLQRKLGAADQALFQERAFFVRSRSTPSDTQMALKASSLYLKRYYNGFHNDGILLTLHQRVRGFGQDLGVLDADHLSLLGNSKNTDSAQIPFVRALLLEILAP